MEGKLSVTLTGPAKVEGLRHPAGATISVAPAIALQLVAAGLMQPVDPGEYPAEEIGQGFSVAAFEAAVEKRALELAGQAFDGAHDSLEAEAKAILADIETLTAEKNAAVIRAESAESKSADLERQLAKVTDSSRELCGIHEVALARITELEAQIDTKPAEQKTNTPAAKTTSKKVQAAQA